MKLDTMLGRMTDNGEITYEKVMAYDVRGARNLLALTRGRVYGGSLQEAAPALLGKPKANLKVGKNEIPTWTLTFTPARSHGTINTCERSTPQCRAVCVMVTSGHGVYENTRQRRGAKTQFFADYPLAFLRLLDHELERIAQMMGGRPWAVRLNTASDIRWERWPWLFRHAGMQAYDYTKWAWDERWAHTLPNYRLTYSASEKWTDLDVQHYVASGRNVAVVFDCEKHQLPATYLGYEVIDGDLSDYRYSDPDGVIVGLAVKGAAKKQDSGDTKVFVRSAKEA